MSQILNTLQEIEQKTRSLVYLGEFVVRAKLADIDLTPQ